MSVAATTTSHENRTLRYLQVGHVVKNKRSALSLAWHEFFHVIIENERFTVAASHCLQNLKYKHFTSLFGRLRQKIKLHQKVCHTCSTINFPHSTNKIDW